MGVSEPLETEEPYTIQKPTGKTHIFFFFSEFIILIRTLSGRLLRIGCRGIRDGIETVSYADFGNLYHVVVKREQHGRGHYVLFECSVVEKKRILLPNMVLCKNAVQINSESLLLLFCVIIKSMQMNE